MPKKIKKENVASVTAPEKIGKQKKLFDNLKRTVYQFVQGKGYTPQTEVELYSRLHLVEQHTELLTEVLDILVKENKLILNKGRYSIEADTSNVIKGVMKLHPRGFGFVTPENSVPFVEDIFIPKHLTANAVDGDIVEVLINEGYVSDKGPEGKIVSIIQRGRTHLGGIVVEVDGQGTAYAYAPMLGTSQKVIIEKGETALKRGDRVVMKVLEWGNKDTATYCVVSRYLGHISDPSCDNSAAIEEYELRNIFPSKASEEARAYGNRVSQTEIRQREDLRNLTCFTIDPDTAKDFDDAISLSKDESGHYHLGVHIADVSHYVKTGTALDIEAQLRCNSTYLPGFALPMLPRELSDNLCSLKPNVNRLAASILMKFDAEGNLLDYRMTRSVIKSAKRFTYKEAKAVLDGTKRSPHLPALKLMVEMCGLLKRKRYERGSIEFGLPELVIIVDEKGVPTKTDYVVYDITHQLVEEFMLKANETVAWHLSNEGKNLTYRVHDQPSPENLKDFSILAAAFGFELSPTPTPKEIQKLFDEAMDTAYGQYLATSYIRRMRLAVYSADNIGHYGLSLTHYCHFTSPIRRYVDLVVHRILFHEDAEKSKLELIAEQCSEQERISSRAENSVVLLKKLRLLDSMHQKDSQKQYEAVVTRVKNFGVYFEVLELMLEGSLHVSELEDDYYVFEDTSALLRGRHNGQVYKAGDKITVMLSKVDLIFLESTWKLVSGPSNAETGVKKKKSKFGKKDRAQKDRPKYSSKRTAKPSVGGRAKRTSSGRKKGK